VLPGFFLIMILILIARGGHGHGTLLPPATALISVVFSSRMMISSH